MTYCSRADVGSRLGLDSSQRARAGTRIDRYIRQASIHIDQTFLDYGRDEPTDHTAETTLNGALNAGATTITLTDASSFSTSGNGNVDGDSFAWSGKSSNDLTGVTGLSFSHLTGVTVQQAEFAHVLREICADIAASFYMQDEGTMQTANDGGLRGQALYERATKFLLRVAHLGKA